MNAATPALPTRTDVLVVGAGPTGLALACALAARGVRALVVDRLAQGGNTSRAAVLHARTLEVLEDVGLVRHAHLGHGAPTYHSSSDAGHLHLVCRACGSVSEVAVSEADEFVGRMRRDHGFDTDVEHFAVFGRCRSCSS